MSTTVQASSPATSPPDVQSAVHLTFPRIVRSEWVKFRTLRSTIWTLGITLLLIVGIVTLLSAIFASQAGAAEPSDGDGGSIVAFTLAVVIAQLAVAVLGVLVITGEYSTGMIRSTLTAVPKRLPALWAKGVVLGTTIFVTTTVAVGISLAVMQLYLGADGLAPDLGEPGTVRILLGTSLYLTAIALLAFAIGAILRHSAGAMATVLGLLLVIENLLKFPWEPFQLISPFLPSTAGLTIMTPQAQLDAMATQAALSQGAMGPVLGPWQGFAVLSAWVAVLLTAAAVLLRRRNA